MANGLKSSKRKQRSEDIVCLRPSAEERKHWNARLVEAFPDAYASKRQTPTERNTPQTFEVWESMPTDVFARTMRIARQRGADSGAIESALTRFEASDDGVTVAVAYRTLGDLIAGMNGAVEPMPAREMRRESIWTRWEWRSHKGSPSVRVHCPCGVTFKATDGHPVPSGDYWRRCVRYFINPDVLTERKQQQRERATTRKRKSRAAHVTSVADKMAMVASLVRARSVEGLTFEERRALTEA